MKRLAVTALLLFGLAPAVLAQRPGGEGQEGMPNGTRVMGTVTAVQGATLSVQTPDGEKWTVITGDNTRISHDRDPGKAADIQVGSGVMAFGQKDTQPNTVRAVFVGYQTAAEVKERMATFGKTWIAGSVKAVNGTQITLDVMAPGGAKSEETTIAVDENTSFQRGRDSITLADVHPGDRVMGQGQVKNGVFTPTTLQVRSPGHGGPGGQGHGPGDGNGPGGPPPPPRP